MVVDNALLDAADLSFALGVGTLDKVIVMVVEGNIVSVNADKPTRYGTVPVECCSLGLTSVEDLMGVTVLSFRLGLSMEVVTTADEDGLLFGGVTTTGGL